MVKKVRAMYTIHFKLTNKNSRINETIGDAKDVRSLAAMFEKSKTQFKVSENGVLLEPKHFGHIEYKHWLTGDQEFDMLTT
jgi:hypothetical protein